MKENPSSLVAFFARGREIGFVVMDNGQLFRYGVKTIKGKRRGVVFTKRIENALSPLLKIVRPHTTIVIEKTENLKRPGALCRTLSQIVKQWEKEKQVYGLSLEEVKLRLCDTRKATHRELMEEVVERHALFKGLMFNGKAGQRRYWEKVILAMALADTAKT